MAKKREMAHRRPSDQPPRRIAALELVATGDAKRVRDIWGLTPLIWLLVGDVCDRAQFFFSQ